MTLIKNRDRLGLKEDDRFFFRGYKTDDGEFYILEEKHGYGKEIHLVKKDDYIKIYDEGGNKTSKISEHSIFSLDLGLSKENAEVLLRKWQKEQKKNKLEILDTLEGYIAVFTGTTGEGEFVEEEEAHNIEGNTREDREINACLVWGVDLDNTNIIHK